MPDYKATVLRRELTVDYLVTVHYYEYSKNFEFDCEQHDFWELVYVDKGEATVLSDGVRYALRQGEMFFHKPNESHAAMANGVVAPNMVILSFGCTSPAMDWFAGRRLTIREEEKELLSRILKEAFAAFEPPFDDPYTTELVRGERSPFGSEQIIGLLLELLLIRLRRYDEAAESPRAMSSLKKRSNNELVQRIMNYMQENVTGNLTFSQVCRYSAQSATNLKTIFKSVTGMGVMEYYRGLKIDEAKRMMREGHHNITQIADHLGYASVHYFSRHFKQATGMTPSEYTLSIQAR